MRRILLTLPLAALLLAGCSSSHQSQVATASSPGPSSASAAAGDPDTRLHQYAACLREHGLKVADPTPGQVAVKLDPNEDPDLTAKAVQACLPYANGAGGDAPAPPTAAELDRLRRYAQCMRDHGVTAFPDPDPQTGFFNGLTKSNYNPSNPTVKAALTACQTLAPTTQPGG
jgi:hypothetical protein